MDMRRTGVLIGGGVLAVVIGFGAGPGARRALSEDKKDESEWTAPDDEAKKANPVASNEASLATGKTVFTRQCVMCHGDQGKGDGPAAGMFKTQPRDLGDPKIVAQSDGAIFWKITKGKGVMPSFEKPLTDNERWSVVNYMRKLAPPPKAPATTSAPATRAK